MLDAELLRETELLRQSWAKHDAGKLRDYLVADVEDPRLNIQSILTRHFIVEQLTGKGFASLREQELRFALVMNWALALRKAGTAPGDFESILHGLKRGADQIEGIGIPGFVTQAFKRLGEADLEWGIPSYFKSAFSANEAPSRSTLAAFQGVWHRILGGQSFGKLSFVEPACGSANDYRFFDAFGLTRFMDYFGFDLCEKNVVNAKEMFSNVSFVVGNILCPDFPDRAFDCALVHDLFEHLSLPAMELALNELCRITAKAICIGFFSMHEGDEHNVRRLDDYHWNTLSAWRIKESLAQAGFEAQLIHIDSFLKACFHCDQTHNKNAYTLIASRRSYTKP
jgi:hypothetical protein